MRRVNDGAVAGAVDFGAGLVAAGGAGKVTGVPKNMAGHCVPKVERVGAVAGFGGGVVVAGTWPDEFR